MFKPDLIFLRFVYFVAIHFRLAYLHYRNRTDINCLLVVSYDMAQYYRLIRNGVGRVRKTIEER